MKKSILYLLISLLSASLMAQVTADDTVYLNPGYTNMSYYSLANGEVANISKTGWDLQIATNTFSAAIRVNDGLSEQIFLPVNHDTSDWASLDTSGMQLYINSDSSWENGALNRMATGHPDYGWGTYNDVTHDLFGDKVFVIHLADGSWKKLFIEKFGVDGSVGIRYADLTDPSFTHASFLRSAYNTKKFVLFSLSSGTVVDNEPIESSWDIVFRQYQTPIPPLDAYTVTGALTAAPIFTAQRDGDAESNSYTGLPFDNVISEIGYDWKEYTGSWTIVADRAYFLMDRDTNFYKIVFTGFGGSANGMIAFSKTTLPTTTSLAPENNNLNKMSVSPNPVVDETQILMYSDHSQNTHFSLMDLTGKLVWSSDKTLYPGLNVLPLDMSSQGKGIYLLKAQSGDQVTIQKVIHQ